MSNGIRLLRLRIRSLGFEFLRARSVFETDDQDSDQRKCRSGPASCRQARRRISRCELMRKECAGASSSGLPRRGIPWFVWAFRALRATNQRKATNERNLSAWLRHAASGYRARSPDNAADAGCRSGLTARRWWDPGCDRIPTQIVHAASPSDNRRWRLTNPPRLFDRL